MDKYLTQLIASMHEISQEYESSALPEPKSIEEHLALLESWITNPMTTIVNYTEISFSHLPPEELLNDEQIKWLYTNLYTFLKSFGITLSLPLAVPLRDKYAIVRDAWEEYDISGDCRDAYIHDFCSGEPEYCRLDKHCNCSKRSSNVENRVPQQRYDHYYYLDPEKEYPVIEEYEEDADDEDYKEYNYELLWKDYNPIEFCESKYVKQLVEDLHRSVQNISNDGTMIIHVDLELENSEALKYQPIHSLLQKEIFEFPEYVDLSVYEADAISKTLMLIFDSSFFNEYLPYQDPFTRYKVLRDFLITDVGFISPGNYLIRPLTQEEAEAEERKVSDFMDKMFGNIDFDKLKGKEDDDIDDDIDEDKLPF